MASARIALASKRGWTVNAVPLERRAGRKAPRETIPARAVGSFKQGVAGVNLACLEPLEAPQGQAYRGAMSDERALNAIDRIETAFARIEAATSGPKADAPEDSELLNLKQSHQALRGKVADAIAQIDRLLASEEV
jgi:hypothetical protein